MRLRNFCPCSALAGQAVGHLAGWRCRCGAHDNSCTSDDRCALFAGHAAFALMTTAALVTTSEQARPWRAGASLAGPGSSMLLLACLTRLQIFLPMYHSLLCSGGGAAGQSARHPLAAQRRWEGIGGQAVLHQEHEDMRCHARHALQHERRSNPTGNLLRRQPDTGGSISQGMHGRMLTH